MSETKGEWVAYKDSLTADGCSIDVRHTGHEKTYTEVAYVFHRDDARLIVTAITALKAINPDNPLAVAQSIKPMYEALKEARVLIDAYTFTHQTDSIANGVKSLIRQALAQAERKAE